MLKIFFVSLLILITNNQQENYREIFGDDYDDALSSVNAIQQEAFIVFGNDSNKVRQAIAIVFPELIRYSMVRDFFETAALELFYIESGKEAADYSIGAFQMKPSFIEELENLAVKNNLEIYNEIGFGKNFTDKQKRRLRIERLKKVTWQLRYLKTFMELYASKEKLIQYAVLDQVMYWAYAYNHGINTSINNENSKQLITNSRYFPYGKRFQGKQYSYAAIALDFYKNYHLQAKR